MCRSSDTATHHGRTASCTAPPRRRQKPTIMAAGTGTGPPGPPPLAVSPVRRTTTSRQSWPGQSPCPASPCPASHIPTPSVPVLAVTISHQSLSRSPSPAIPCLGSRSIISAPIQESPYPVSLYFGNRHVPPVSARTVTVSRQSLSARPPYPISPCPDNQCTPSLSVPVGAVTVSRQFPPRKLPFPARPCPTSHRIPAVPVPTAADSPLPGRGISIKSLRKPASPPVG